MTDIDFCWSRIGIEGDHSCPELARVIHCRNCAVFARAARQALERPAPPEYLAEWAQRVATGADDAHGSMRSCVVFRLGTRHLALPTSSFIEAIEPRAVRTVPHRANQTLLGLANIRGELQLCVSLHGLLGLPCDDASTTRPRFAVIEQAGQRWVFPVDEIYGVHRVAEEALQPAPDGASPFIGAEFDLAAQPVGLLDAELIGAALLRAVA